ncbi:Orotidine 5'-phosphate decarboxylase [Lepidopterella palustris CBS 459.81]|uniref:Orotidine 5'-phosphate decarboxylase n=1 Tax=Lepidopterella palustris CBS 459.81 TaxID=1314670 RepID=A0A8E2E1I2_9PEZI|nr:Orotidine 5'-phosphate decarboxylase [Lepidopterella palustris CBS 459.81]
MSTARHPTWTCSYRERAVLPNTSSLAAYLLRLIAIKKTNLCLSADVTTTAELLAIAEEVGDSICVLKTHADIVSDFSDRTMKGLRDIARRKHFLIFEDRKFADIGETVQKQYTGGPLRIARWAEITNAHILPGPAIVTALREAAASTIASYNTAVHTEITASPPTDHDDDHDVVPSSTSADPLERLDVSHAPDRKHSVVSISTTISTRTESISPHPRPDIDHDDGADTLALLERLGEAPYLRSLLLLAEMSSEGHLLTGAYTATCVQIARAHRDFVMGFIAQHALNSEPADNFITMSPGVQLPPAGQKDGKKLGDALGQQYNSPRKIVLEQGCDVIIVGRGILKAADRREEAERYRREGWRAYEERVGLLKA